MSDNLLQILIAADPTGWLLQVITVHSLVNRAGAQVRHVGEHIVHIVVVTKRGSDGCTRQVEQLIDRSRCDRVRSMTSRPRGHLYCGRCAHRVNENSRQRRRNSGDTFASTTRLAPIGVAWRARWSAPVAGLRNVAIMGVFRG